MEFSDPLLDPNILSRLKIISDCRERFELSETDEERQFQAHLALDEFSHLFRELCDWSLEYRVGLTKLWSEGTPVSSPQQVIEAAQESQINNPDVARAFLANFLDVLGGGAGSVFNSLAQELALLDWGEVGPILTPAKTKRPAGQRTEWEFRLKALLHLSYFRGLNGHGSRDDNIYEVEKAFGLKTDTLID